MKIILPNKLSSDYAGFSFLAKLSSQLGGLMLQNIELSFEHNTWFEANLCAVLGAIINKSQANLNDFTFTNMQPLQKNIMSRNHFLASFGGVKIEDGFNTTIKYRKSKISDEKLIHEYLFRELLGKEEFPKLSIGLKKEIERSIFEIYSNAIIHGGSENIYSCGQHFPNKIPARVDFTIVNMGITIKENVSNFLKIDIAGKEAIVWAANEHNTTKPKEENIPGGLGLKIIQQFAKLNNGKIQIVSDNGYWQFTPKGITSNTIPYSFKGTIVNMEFNLDDKASYYLISEQDEEIVF